MTPSPSSVSAVPIATTTSTKAPAASPSTSTPNRLEACSTIACSTVITSVTGRISTPIPMNRRNREAYMRAAAERIWPQARRCASRNGAVGRHVARLRPYATSASAARVTAIVGHGSLTARHSSREPPAMAPQKKSVVRVPAAPPAGTAYARSRQLCDQRIGSVHCSFRLGPVGPLKKAGCCSPQRPWNPIQGNAAAACDGSLGIVCTAGCVTRPAFRVSSHPTPCDPDAPRYSASP